jgi:hypothetical protein
MSAKISGCQPKYVFFLEKFELKEFSEKRQKSKNLCVSCQNKLTTIFFLGLKSEKSIWTKSESDNCFLFPIVWKITKHNELITLIGDIIGNFS